MDALATGNKTPSRYQAKDALLPKLANFPNHAMNGCTRALRVPFANLRIVSMPAIAHPPVFSYYNPGEGFQNQLDLSALQPPVVFSRRILVVATPRSR